MKFSIVAIVTIALLSSAALAVPVANPGPLPSPSCDPKTGKCTNDPENPIDLKRPRPRAILPVIVEDDRTPICIRKGVTCRRYNK